MTDDDELDDEDDGSMTDEEIWDSICQFAANRAGVSVERARAILYDAGYYAYGHTGIVEAVDVVSHALGRRF
jgi:hypothetical protein